MKQLLSLFILTLAASPALADVAPTPPQRGFALGLTLLVLGVIAVIGVRLMRRRRGG